jgi:hypothetical protein
MLYNASIPRVRSQEVFMRLVGTACLSLLLVAASLSAPAPKTTLPVISYADLGKEVRSLKGKVVVVYFWADY